jgi:hypothetical protein
VLTPVSEKKSTAGRKPIDVVVMFRMLVLQSLYKADAGLRSRLADLGLEIFPGGQQTPGAVRAFQKAEIEKWWPIIKAANIRGE